MVVAPSCAGSFIAHFFQFFELQNMSLILPPTRRFLGNQQTIDGQNAYLSSVQKALFGLSENLFVAPDSRHFSQEIHLSEVRVERKIQSCLNGRRVKAEWKSRRCSSHV